VGEVQAQMLAYEDKTAGFCPLIPKKLQRKIQAFKDTRSTVLHSEMGACILILNMAGKQPRPETKEFQELTHTKVKVLIEEGIEIIEELHKIALESIPKEWYAPPSQEEEKA